MAASDLHAVAVRHERGLPADHAVALGVDARQANAVGRKLAGEVASKAAVAVLGQAQLRSSPPAAQDDVSRARGGKLRGPAGREHSAQAGPDRDRVRHELWATV